MEDRREDEEDSVIPEDFIEDDLLSCDDVIESPTLLDVCFGLEYLDTERYSCVDPYL